MLWKARKEIAGIQAGSYVCSLAMGKVSEGCRMVNVVPLLNKDCNDKSGNYRPVSITSVMDKVLLTDS